MAPTAIDIQGVSDTEGIAIPDPVTVNTINARRAKAGKFVAGVAATTTSDYYKSPVRFLPFPLGASPMHG